MSVLKFAPAEDAHHTLTRLGVLTPGMIQAQASEPQRYVVEGLFFDRSVNILVGASCLGKTPLVMSMGIAVAAGIPWLGRAVEKGPVLFLDGEMPRGKYVDTLGTLARHSGLQGVPEDFYTFSLNFSCVAMDDALKSLREQVKAVRPKLVIIDPLRMFFATAETKAEEAQRLNKALRNLANEFGCSVLLVHHPRKTRADAFDVPDLAQQPYAWLEGAAGSAALINHSDTRLGIEAGGPAGVDLLVGGLMRGEGPITPLMLTRVVDEAGMPQGYELATGRHLLLPEQRDVFDRLPSTFRYKDVQAACCRSLKTDQGTAVLLAEN